MMSFLVKFFLLPLENLIKKFLIFFIHIYQKTLSPYIGQACRFEPTCSQYALDCLNQKNLLRGLFLIFYRLIRCNPLHPGGIDKL